VPILVHMLTWLFAPARPLGRIAVQDAGHLSALDPDADIDDATRLAQRRFLLQALVRTVAVMAAGVPALTFAEMPLAGDQHPVQALAAVRSGEPFRAGACRGGRNSVLMTRVPFPASTSGAVAEACQQGARLLCRAVQAPADGR